MQILFTPALKIKSLKRISFSYLGKAQKTFLSVVVMYAKNFLIHYRSLLLFWGLPLAQAGFSAFLQQRCSSRCPKSRHPPSHLQSGACKHRKLTPALKPFRLPVMKPKAWTVGAFRVSVLFQVASCSIRRSSKSSMASHSCRCLVNHLQEISGKPKDESIWEAGSLKFSLPLVWYSWKKKQLRSLEHHRQWACMVFGIGLYATAKFLYCNFSILSLFSSSAIKNSTFNVKQSQHSVTTIWAQRCVTQL